MKDDETLKNDLNEDKRRAERLEKLRRFEELRDKLNEIPESWKKPDPELVKLLEEAKRYERMTVTLKHVLYATVGFWTALALAEIWNVSNLDGRALASMTVLNIAGVLTMWLKGK